MRRLLKAIAMTALLLCPSSRISAQAETVEIVRVQLADSLSGLVRDPAGAPVPKVIVQESSPDWKRPLRSTQTDPHGVFSLTPVHGRRVYYLQLSARGFNPLRVRVQVDPKRGGKLRLKLYLAT
jgi:Carboxypeptidase regulatory-like domain